MNTNGTRVGWMISLASAGYGGSQVTEHFLQPHLVFQPVLWVERSWLFQLLQSNFSQEGA